MERMRHRDKREAKQGYEHCPLKFLPAQPKAIGLPFAAYFAVDEVREDGTDKAQKVFVSVPTEVGQTEAEEIGG